MSFWDIEDRVNDCDHTFAYKAVKDADGWVIRQRGKYVSGPHSKEYAFRQADRFNRREGNYDD